MKTTIELPDKLMLEARAVAVRRRTTLRALFTHALQREIHGGNFRADPGIEVDVDGLPRLPARGVKVTNETIKRILDDEIE